MNPLLDPKTLCVAAAVFLTPLIAVVFTHRDQIIESMQPDPNFGTVLYFTSPT